MNEKKLTDLLRFPAAETGGRPPDCPGDLEIAAYVDEGLAADEHLAKKDPKTAELPKD